METRHLVVHRHPRNSSTVVEQVTASRDVPPRTPKSVPVNVARTRFDILTLRDLQRRGKSRCLDRNRSVILQCWSIGTRTTNNLFIVARSKFGVPARTCNICDCWARPCAGSTLGLSLRLGGCCQETILFDPLSITTYCTCQWHDYARRLNVDHCGWERKAAPTSSCHGQSHTTRPDIRNKGTPERRMTSSNLVPDLEIKQPCASDLMQPTRRVSWFFRSSEGPGPLHSPRCPWPRTSA